MLCRVFKWDLKGVSCRTTYFEVARIYPLFFEFNMCTYFTEVTSPLDSINFCFLCHPRRQKEYGVKQTLLPPLTDHSFLSARPPLFGTAVSEHPGNAGAGSPFRASRADLRGVWAADHGHGVQAGPHGQFPHGLRPDGGAFPTSL